MKLEPPVFEVHEFSGKKTRYCVVIIVFNEGDRLRDQLARMKVRADEADIIIADGRSTDGSTESGFLRKNKVRTLLVTDESGLSTATRMGYAYAMEQNYDGVITIDGNGKDGVEAVSAHIVALDQGYDLVQGSRFIGGGYHKNTPLDRYLGIRFVMAPLLGIGGGFYYTDPTPTFRACSMRFLKDKRVQPLRAIFVRFNLHLYLNYRAAKLGFKVKEIAIRRVYPDDGTVPTKIHGFRTKFINLWEAVRTVLGAYNPRF